VIGILFRKMISEKWIVLCLLAGFITAVGVICAVPIYTDASLQRLLLKDMEKIQTETGRFPGEYAVAGSGSSAIAELPAFAERRAARAGLPISSRKLILRDSMLYMIKGSKTAGESLSVDRVKLTAMSGFADHAKITSSRMYSGQKTASGAVETVATETAMKTLGISLGEEYKISPVNKSRNGFSFVVVGTFEPSDENDVYWSETLDSYLNVIVADYDLYLDELIPEGTAVVSDVEARYALGYQKLDMNRLEAVTAALKEDEAAYAEAGYVFTMSILPILTDYAVKAKSLSRTLWALQIPVTVMLGFYLFMVSRLNLEREGNEISLLKSRGASTAQVFAVYAAYNGVLALIALITAPFAGLMLCRFLGVSDGFLQFVNRKGLTAKITPTALIYALIAAFVFFAASILPIIPASRLSIVQYKQSRVKSAKTPLWEKIPLDLLLIAAGIIFARVYSNSAKPDGEINPLLFVFSSFFIMGLGLFFLRVYPCVLSLIYRLGGRFWTPPQYIALNTVRRGGGGERFLMMFLAVTFSLGIFSANTARAVNNNKRDTIRYANGADVVVREYKLETSGGDDAPFAYKETDFSKYQSLIGVETAAKVLRNDSARLSFETVPKNGKKSETITFMAVEPDVFAKTAWFRDDLLPVHWYNYCNALTDARNGVIVSRSMNLPLGDSLTVKWGNNTVTAPIIAIADWWPGINPYAADKNGAVIPFAVMNYNYIRSLTEPEPYEIWLNMKDGASSADLYADIKAKHLPIKSVDDASQKLIAEKTDPGLQGINGTMTLGFTVIMAMTVIGFLLYWILSFKGRTLQFGVVRAMGMTFRELISVIIYEQILVSGAAIAAAFIIGGVTGDMFIPLFGNAAERQVPPFYVFSSRSDYVKMYIIIAAMLILGFSVLGGIIKRMNINKALKLGED